MRSKAFSPFGGCLAAAAALACASVPPVAGVCAASQAGLAADMQPDSAAVCSALSSSSTAADTTVLLPHDVTSNNVESALQTASRSPLRILYFSGHGRLTEGKDDVQLAMQGSEDLSTEWVSFSSVAASLTKSNSGWAVALLNTCNSGYARMLPSSRPITVLGSGYGRVNVDTKQASAMSPFASALARALAGYADIGPYGNCDGVVTDREAADYTNFVLRTIITPSKDIELWRKRPSAVLRRQWTGELPVTWHALERSCSPVSVTDLLGKAWVKSLPGEFRQALAHLELWQRPPRDGTTSEALVATDPSYLFVDGAVSISADDRMLLENRGMRLGARVVSVSVPPNELRALARAAFFTDVLQLTQRPAYDSAQSILRLVRLRDSAVLWTNMGDTQRRFPVRAMLRALPSRFELFDSGLEQGEVAVENRSLFVQANARVSSTTRLFLMRWDAFLEGRTHQEALAIDWTTAVVPVPCLGGYGQCFSVPDPACHDDTPCGRRVPWEWVVVE